MPRPTTFVSRGGIFIPLSRYEPLWKIQIIDDLNTTHTVLNSYSGAVDEARTLSAQFTRTATDSLGSFRITLSNLDGQFLRKFNGGEIVDIFLDFTDATTRVFRGKVDNVTYGLTFAEGWVVYLDGRDYPEIADDVTIIQFSNKNAIYALKGSSSGGTLIDSQGNWDDGILYGTGLKWDPANTITVGDVDTTITQAYQNRSYLEIMRDICKQAGLDFYIHYDGNDWLIRVFEEESIINSDEYISYGENLSTVGEFGYNNNEVKNKIIVYGQNNNNIIRIKTKEDATSQANFWIKTKVITDSSLSEVSELTNRALSELSQSSTSTQKGRLTSLVLSTLNPGEVIRITVPYCDIDGNYKISSFTTEYGRNSGSFTTVNVSKKTDRVSDLFQDAYDIEKALTPYNNLNNMSNSLNFDFDDDEGSLLVLSNCELSEGILRLSSGQASGVCESRIVSTVTDGQADENITKCELRIDANNYTNCTYEVSNNDGNTWETVTPGTLHTFSSSGKKLRVRINLATSDDISPEFGAICVLFK